MLESEVSSKTKTKQQYSRNVKKLKVKLAIAQSQIQKLSGKIDILQNTSNDKIMTMKLSKFCKERNFTPEMLFRFADKRYKGKVTVGDFKDTLLKIGFKFSSQQMKRLLDLLDEDLSGQITYQQFIAFLYAFGLKKQPGGEDDLIKNALGKLNIDKLRQLMEDDELANRGDKQNKRKRILLNYEQFLKYCHKHIPGLSNKQLASIFNRLQKNGYVDLEQLLQYLKNREQQQKRLKQKNKKKNTPDDTKKQEISSQFDLKTLEGKIKSLLKNRPKDSVSMFHSSEFQRLETVLKQPKGSYLSWFKRIDKRKVGSFGYNELIQDFIEFEGRKQNIMFAFQLMGCKITAYRQKPEDIISQYNSKPEKLFKQQFHKLMVHEFQIIPEDILRLFAALTQNQNAISVRIAIIINAMKITGEQRRLVHIKPALWGTSGTDFLRKDCSTILLNPILTLRLCILISEELRKEQNLKWDDYQFGPTFADPTGQSSIQTPLQSQKLEWKRVQQLGMKQFYFSYKDHKYQSTSQCLHEILPKTLTSLVNNKQQVLWSQAKIDFSKTQIVDEDLQQFFKGIRPRIFHEFAQYGIYVFKFFIKQKFAYVIIDDKIPCNGDGKAIFSTSNDVKLSWISLIQKAFAKLYGSYGKIFEIPNNYEFIYSLSRQVVPYKKLSKNFNNEQQKDQLWNLIVNSLKNQNGLFTVFNDSKEGSLTFDNVITGFIKNKPTKIHHAIQIKDSNCNNSHKSHRLVFLEGRELLNEEKWNLSWSKNVDNNKMTKFQQQIKLQLKNNKNFSMEKQGIIVINYKVLRSIFSNLLQPFYPIWHQQVILRKRIEIQDNLKCKYVTSSSKPMKFVFTLKTIRNPKNGSLQIATITEGIKRQYPMQGQFTAWQLTLQKQTVIQIGIKNAEKGADYHFSLTFYYENQNYELKQRDRHLLFQKVSKYDEDRRVNWSSFQDKQRAFLLKKFRNAERSRTCLCC